ncbi:MAG: alpha-amylase family protein [Anaerolineae bacterium]|nr:alpha-amylase family protein [Anaerolineae bacterium]
MERKAQKSLDRLRPRIEPVLEPLEAEIREVFWQRMEKVFPEAFALLLELYGTYYSFFYHLENILKTIAQAYVERPPELRTLDSQREQEPLWFQSEQMVGGVCYVDLFAGDLAGVREKILYFKELGLTYLHLMPLYKVPEINDGGYAVSSYREVDPDIGTIDELRQLATDLRAEGISLVLDFVFNHTSDEHDWAKQALAGDEDYQEYYLMFPDRTMPDQYEQNLREIFPESAPGNFTYQPKISRWVWTTFNTFQWDLKYSNPAVFAAMLGELLFLANVGVEILRLDAVPFVWKELGTSCENLPQAHTIIQAFNALVRITAPALVFKSEAIVHPDDVAKYFGLGERAGYECPISYNPTLMALLWEALATQEVRLLRYSMQGRFQIPENCSWVNYVRVHDDIGWSFADEDANALWMNPFDHRQFLNTFYTGRFPNSFANGLLFNYNPLNKDGRINGTCASLAGLEKAINAQNEVEIELAIRRILLIHSVILSIGGIPLIYLGDEVGTLNDYSYQQDEYKFDDSRWVHRPYTDWERMEKRHDPTSIEGRVFQALCHLIQIRKSNPVFSGNKTQVVETGNPHIFGYIHWQFFQGMLVLTNFSERPHKIDMARFRTYGVRAQMHDLVKAADVNLARDYVIEPYEFVWLVAK